MKPSNYLKELYRNPTDEKNTPGYGVLPIIKYIPENKIIWCPFDTEHSEFVLKFKAAGFEVVYSHICKGQDFFEYEPPQWDVLVSNPPFSRKVDVFDRCLKFGKPFALLMSNYWLNNVAPCRLFLNTELELLMFDKRIQFGEGKNVPFNSSYFCHRILPKPIIFEQMYIADKSPSRMQEDLPETDGCQSAGE
ncbi:tRNA (adenine-N(6)-)-methyltransferase [Bacteroides caccae]|uniref:tRNA (Adenine-N(6)-)-methyltransferase n=1 Tax=Bacteroides caccae TaxID=47678 RepID=A0A833BGD4_9BACE|nr:tRNA (adenine-N(6)-)-methyltransferase [Bacteroides caccae]KAA5493014.1 tRNA (adenine-N(6)-)-methyltransferase [Bacteroides caccae]